MPRKQTFSDERLQELLDRKMLPVRIAEELGVDPATVSRRIKAIQARTSATAPVDDEDAARDRPRSVAEMIVVLWENYDRTQTVFAAGTAADAGTQLRALREARAYLDAIIRCTERLYDIRENQDFEAAILAVLDDLLPELRQKAIEGFRLLQASRFPVVDD